MKLTIITKIDGVDGESYVGTVRGELTSEQKDHLRLRFGCDPAELDPYAGEMLFQVLDLLDRPDDLHDLFNADGENYPPV